mmetsp:Transcript_29107/g.86174  ORF Transcript_29107/g.86174 Transcript_29107/m.86174 type:complete len:90 (+) Transcript_29107:885-1154(+)
MNDSPLQERYLRYSWRCDDVPIVCVNVNVYVMEGSRVEGRRAREAGGEWNEMGERTCGRRGTFIDYRQRFIQARFIRCRQETKEGKKMY